LERIPILKVGDFLLVSVQIDLHDQLATSLEADITNMIVSTGARGVVVDVSVVPMVDSFIGRTLGDIAAVARVLDAETVLVGIQPAVAITLVELGLSFKGLHTALNVDRGLDLLRNLIQAKNGHGGR
jgi:rsbT antagonist protein RsbS